MANALLPSIQLFTKLILLVLKTHQKILGKIFWVRVNEPNSNFYIYIFSDEVFL
jgi:hypothetical protein